MEKHHQRLSRTGSGLVENSKQLPGRGGSTAQGWNWNLKRLPLIRRQPHRAKGVPQGLQVSA
jgi:hypothetical protein